MLYIVGKIFSKVIKLVLTLFKKKIEKYISIQSFETTRVPILGPPIWSLEEK